MTFTGGMVSTWYYVTFEMEDGQRHEFSLYRMLAEGRHVDGVNMRAAQTWQREASWTPARTYGDKFPLLTSCNAIAACNNRQLDARQGGNMATWENASS
jgi:hypothetical protein